MCVWMSASTHRTHVQEVDTGAGVKSTERFINKTNDASNENVSIQPQTSAEVQQKMSKVLIHNEMVT